MKKKPNSKTLDEDINNLTPEQKILFKEISKMRLDSNEVKYIVKQLQIPKKEKDNRIKRNYGGKKLKIGIVSDWHHGHQKFRYDIYEDSVHVFNREKVDEIYIPGDIIEGMSNREGHIYELAIPGVTTQLESVINLLNGYKQPILAILGNHDLWAMKKSNQGVHIGKTLEDKVKNFTYLGDMSGDIDLGNNICIRMTHEGNSCYALSYSSQKRINALSGGDKPNILLNGHLHKGLYMFYRNIHAMECMSLQDQTDFMKMKGAPSHVGFSIVDIKYNKHGVMTFQPTFYPYY